ncbi:MAG: hypothetical protein HQL22_03005 [Candidatus Omnitrophica bacterium]|nr:hypothetical protein [Candidatus Omnitrophota bacterium]
MADKDDFISLVFASISFPRDSYSAIGDVLLFRPLTFCFLGLERFLFGYNFYLWQLTGILLHFGVVFSLGSLLWVIRPGMSAIMATGFFALQLTNVSMVNWNQINPYLVFTALLLWALRELYLFEQDAERRVVRVYITAILMTIASLFYEGGVFYSVLMFLYLLWISRRQHSSLFVSAWMLLPVIVYTGFDYWDISLRHFAFNAESGLIINKLFSFETIFNAARTFKWFLCCGLFLAPADIIESVRTYVLPHTLTWQWPFIGFQPQMIRGVVIILTTLAILRVGYSREYAKKQASFLLLLAVIMFTYVVVIVLGRVNPRGFINGLLVSSYYLYIFWALLTVFVYTMFDLSRCQRHSFWKTCRWLPVILIVLTAGVNTVYIREVNAMILAGQRETRIYINYVGAFVREHQSEKAFTFDIASGCPGSFPDWVAKEKQVGGGIAESYYHRYIDHDHPRYHLMCPSY